MGHESDLLNHKSEECSILYHVFQPVRLGGLGALNCRCRA